MSKQTTKHTTIIALSFVLAASVACATGGSTSVAQRSTRDVQTRQHGASPTTTATQAIATAQPQPSPELHQQDKPQLKTRRNNVGIKSFWTGTSGGYRLTWTTADLIAERNGERTSVLLPIAEKEFARYVKEQNEMFADDITRAGEESKRVAGASSDRAAEVLASGTFDCDHEQRFAPLSVVGTFVSVEERLYTSCTSEAHPGGETRYRTIDLRDPAREVRLTDLFPEEQILRALMNDAAVKEALTGEPRSLAELPDAVDASLPLAPDYLARFAFHNLEGDQVAVRLGVSSNAGADRYGLRQIGILLPVPGELREALTAAAARRAGFLMKDKAKVIGAGATTISHTIGGGAKH